MPREQLYTRNAPTVDQARDMVSRTIQVRAESVDEDARSVEAIVATERVVQVFDWHRERVIDEVLTVRGAVFPDRVSLLANHNRYDLDAVHGGVRGFNTSGDTILATLVFDNDERSERAWGKVKRGFINDVSVGYRVDESQDIQPGESATIAGRTYTAKGRVLRVATKWTIREVSLVPVGADPAAKIREEPGASNSLNHHRSIQMHPRLRKYLIQCGMRSDASEQEAMAFKSGLTGEQLRQASAIEANPEAYDDSFALRSDAGAQGGSGTNQPPAGLPPSDGERNDPAPPTTASSDVDPQAVARRAAQDERERISGIRELASDQTPEALITRAINENWTSGQAATAFLQHERGLRSGEQGGGAQPQAPAMHNRTLQGNDLARALGAGLCLRGGLAFDQLNVSERTEGDDRRRSQERLADMGERYSDMSLVDFCRHSLQAEGRTVPHGREDMIRAAMSTATLAHVFTDSVNAHAVMGYETASDTSRSWTEEGDVSDFKPNTDITLGKSSGMRKIARGGTAPDATIDDEAETYKVARFGEKFIIDEQDIIDDMMNILTEMPREMTEEAAQLRPDLVYSILLASPTMGDTIALFDAAHNNTQTPVLGATGLTTALVEMAKQVRGTRQLNLQGRHLIVPHDLKFTGRQLIHSSEIREALAANGTKNVLADEDLNLVAENRIGAAGVVDPDTGIKYTGSATNWFVSAARRTIKVVYLRGTNRRPTVRNFVLTQGQWGIGWDIKLDIGAFARDWRGLQYSDGSV